MAIQSVTLLWADMTATSDENGVKVFTQTYQVISDDPLESRAAVGSAPGIPPKYSILAEDPTCWARNASIARISESRLVWNVTVEFSNEQQPKQEQERDEEPDPIQRPARVKWSSSTEMRAVDKDINGNAIVNSAGDYFDPPPEVEVEVWSAHVTKNYATVPPWLLSYANSKNEAPFVIGGLPVDTGKAKLGEMSISELQKENDIEFYEVAFTIKFDEDGWDLKLLDQGLHEIDNDGHLVKIKVNGEDAAAPVLLDAGGHVLENPGPDTAEFLTFVVKRPKDFTILPGCSAPPS